MIFIVSLLLFHMFVKLGHLFSDNSGKGRNIVEMYV